MHRLKILFSLLLIGAAVPTTARAATVDARPDSDGLTTRVVFFGTSGQPDRVSFTQNTATTLTVEDVSAPLSAREGCTQETPNRATCTVGSRGFLEGFGGDGDDTIAVSLMPGGPFDFGADNPAGVNFSGGAGNDTMTGGPSGETFYGNAGNDTINPGGGRDLVGGDEGDDTIDVRDAPANSNPFETTYRDGVGCGDGTDSLRADATDAQALGGDASCETVDAPSAGSYRAGGKLTLRTRKATFATTTGTLKARCQAGAPCTGRLRITVGLTVVASAKVALQPGASGTLRVKLTSAGRKALRRTRSLKASAATVQADGSSSAAGSVRLLLRKR